MVEYDPDILIIAKKYFGFPEPNTRLIVEIDNAFNFLKNTSNNKGNNFVELVNFLEDNKQDIIMVDLATNMNQQGISCPPPNFLTYEALYLMKECLRENGKFF